MRGSDQRSGTLFSYVDLKARVRPDHPLRAIRQLTDVALAAPNPDFSALYAARLAMIEPRADRPKAISLDADKAYDTEDYVNELRSMNVRAHVAQNTKGRRSSIDRRATRHAGYGMR